MWAMPSQIHLSCYAPSSFTQHSFIHRIRLGGSPMPALFLTLTPTQIFLLISYGLLASLDLIRFYWGLKQAEKLEPTRHFTQSRSQTHQR